MAETVKTTVTLPADVHWKFKEEAAKRRMADKDAVEEAFRLWIGVHAVSVTDLLSAFADPAGSELLAKAILQWKDRDPQTRRRAG